MITTDRPGMTGIGRIRSDLQQPAAAMTDTSSHHRSIRSFVRREGRMTRSQQRALDELLPVYGLPPDRPVDARAVFGRSAPLTLEIGFGNGEALATMAGEDPATDFIGIEVHRPGVGHLLLRMEREGLTNIRIAHHDAQRMVIACTRVLRTESDMAPLCGGDDQLGPQRQRVSIVVANSKALVFGHRRRRSAHRYDADSASTEHVA